MDLLRDAVGSDGEQINLLREQIHAASGT